MGVIQDCIGKRWERVFHRRYPEFDSRCDDERGPDFYHPDGFWVEAKAGNRLWGGRIKPAQLEFMGSLDNPVVYAFGMHNLDDIFKKLRKKTEAEIKEYLRKNMQFVEVYFVSGDVVNMMFQKEKRESEKEGLVYCMIKPSMLRNIILDRPFCRFDEEIPSSENYYGFSRGDYKIGFRDGVGYILHKRKEAKAVKVLVV